MWFDQAWSSAFKKKQPTAAMATVATAATSAAPNQRTKQLLLLALVLALALALVSVLAVHANALASAAKEWAAPTLQFASTCACIFNLATATLLARRGPPTPALSATAAHRDPPTTALISCQTLPLVVEYF